MWVQWSEGVRTRTSGSANAIERVIVMLPVTDSLTGRPAEPRAESFAGGVERQPNDRGLAGRHRERASRHRHGHRPHKWLSAVAGSRRRGHRQDRGAALSLANRSDHGARAPLPGHAVAGERQRFGQARGHHRRNSPGRGWRRRRRIEDDARRRRPRWATAAAERVRRSLVNADRRADVGGREVVRLARRAGDRRRKRRFPTHRSAATDG